MRPTILSVLAPLAAPLAQQVHIVDDSGGADFTDLPAAVAAAVSGDTLLVKGGTYSGFTINAKSLVVTADTGAFVSLGEPIRVRNLGPSDRVVLSGLRATSTESLGALELTSNQGHIHVETCHFEAVWWFPTTVTDAVRVIDCASAVFVDCSMEAALQAPDTFTGGIGLRATNSNVSAFDSTMYGGDGLSAILNPLCIPGGPGGAGVLVHGGFLHLSGCDTTGGDGGAGTYAFPDCTCSNGGHGGAGVQVGGGALFERRDTAAAGGVGGKGGSGGQCIDGAPGQPVLVTSGSVVELPGAARGFSISVNPVREGQSTTASFSGSPGELTFLLASGQPDCTPLPPVGGVVLVGPPLFVSILGTLDAGGSLTKPFTVQPFNDPADEVVPVYEQALMWNATDGFTLALGRAVILLDAQF